MAMRLREFFGRWRQTEPGNQSGPEDRAIDDLVEETARNVLGVDPMTDHQWQRLRASLTRKEGASERTRFGLANARPAFAVGLALVIVLAIGVVWLLKPSLRTYITGQGQQATILLADSTQVMLNHTSKLTVSHSLFGGDRRVGLTGEAYFRVRNNGTPFVVSTALGTVRVLGTEFNVLERDGQLEVGVVRGQVRVRCSGNIEESGLTLSANQIVACTTTGFAEKPSKLPFAEYPGWIHGKIMLYHSTLSSACKELESQFGITIMIQNPQLRDVMITGTIDGHDADVALAALASLTRTTVRHEESGYILY